VTRLTEIVIDEALRRGVHAGSRSNERLRTIRGITVTTTDFPRRWPAVLLTFLGSAALTAAIAALAAPAAADLPPPPPPPPPAAAPAPPAASDADLDAQLAAARRKLEQAAREVAQLSAEVSGRVVDSVMPYFGPRAIIGVQLERNAAGGARVRDVSPAGPAAQAGIRPGDVIVAVNGTELKGAEPARQVVRIMRGVEPDARVSVRALRDGHPRDFTVIARAAPMALVTARGLPNLDLGPVRIRDAFMLNGPLGDMELATLTPRLGSYFGSDKGVLVVRAPEDGALKLEDGDVILAIDGREPTSGSHATRILGSYSPGEKITLRILRQHKPLQLEASLPERPRRREADVPDEDVFYLSGGDT
jgi:predicted metalloprotease with PDZ domain